MDEVENVRFRSYERSSQEFLLNRNEDCLIFVFVENTTIKKKCRRNFVFSSLTNTTSSQFTKVKEFR